MQMSKVKNLRFKCKIPAKKLPKCLAISGKKSYLCNIVLDKVKRLKSSGKTDISD